MISKHGNVSVATCLRCGFRAGARNLVLLERTVQDHSCGASFYRGDERRAFARRPVFLKALCYGRLGSAPCVVTDMSESGIGVRSTLPRSVGDEVTAAWRFVADDKPFRISGIVRRASAGTLGIEFLDLSAADRYRIAHFLNSQP